jgi:hypothetical protein
VPIVPGAPIITYPEAYQNVKGVVFPPDRHVRRDQPGAAYGRIRTIRQISRGCDGRGRYLKYGIIPYLRSVLQMCDFPPRPAARTPTRRGLTKVSRAV